MAKLTTGLAGCGKTAKLLLDIGAFIEQYGANPQRICVIAMSESQRRELLAKVQKKWGEKSPRVFSFESFVAEFFLGEKTANKKIVSRFLAIELISAISKSEFLADSSLKNLCKSKSFSRELYNLFSLFQNNLITSEIIDDAIEKSALDSDEKPKLRLINIVFKKYLQAIIDAKKFDITGIVGAFISKLNNEPDFLDSIKDKFDSFFVDGFEDITYLQFVLLTMLAKPSSLMIYGDSFSRIQEFKGAWCDSLIFQSLSNHLGELETTQLKDSKRNEDILKRAFYLVQRYNSQEVSFDFQKNDNIKYLKFDDIKSEIDYIANDILSKKQSGSDFSDFAILIRDYEARQKFIDLFAAYNIPLSSQIVCDEFRNFLHRTIRYLNIFEIAEKLGAEEFTKEGLSNPKLKSKAQIEILYEDMNLYVGNIISELIEDPYTKDRFVSWQESSSEVSLLNIIWKNLSILSDSDKEKLQSEFNLLARLYFYFQQRDYGIIFDLIADSCKSWVENDDFQKCHKVLKGKIGSIELLYSDVIKSQIPLATILDLLLLYPEQNSDDKDSVSLLTFFETSGCEFENVYIPCLGEGDFPKKSKSTYFISPQSNTIVSEILRTYSKNFRNLIELDEDAIKEESRLFYLGMTRAKAQLIISAHVFEDKKQIQPSVFFELLRSIDPDNYSEPKVQEQSQNDEKFEKKTCQKPQNKVLQDDLPLRLSVSSVSNFLKCPKKYYYKNLLALREKRSFSADYGSIVHMIMEVFNKKYLDSYTKETMLMLSDVIFDAKNNPKKALSCGFKARDIELIQFSDDLNLLEMKGNFEEAVVELEESGFFLSVPDKVLTEKGFEFSIPSIDGVVFDGRIDAIVQKDGEYSLWDYKTGKTKDIPLRNLAAFEAKGGKEPTNMEEYLQKYDYQIPIYYFACKNAQTFSELKGQIKELGFQYIRPIIKDGCQADIVEAQAISQAESKLFENLDETVVRKIKAAKNFAPNYDDWTCANCAYAFLCDKDEEAYDD